MLTERPRLLSSCRGSRMFIGRRRPIDMRGGIAKCANSSPSADSGIRGSLHASGAAEALLTAVLPSAARGFTKIRNTAIQLGTRQALRGHVGRPKTGKIPIAQIASEKKSKHIQQESRMHLEESCQSASMGSGHAASTHRYSSQTLKRLVDR